MSTLQGKKTYIIDVCGILYAVFGVMSGHLDFYSAVDIIFAALSVMGLRNGITTEIKNLLSQQGSQPPQQ